MGSILILAIPSLALTMESILDRPGRTILPLTEIAVDGSSLEPSLKVSEPSCVAFIALSASITEVCPGNTQAHESEPDEADSGSYRKTETSTWMDSAWMDGTVNPSSPSAPEVPLAS